MNIRRMGGYFLTRRRLSISDIRPDGLQVLPSEFTRQTLPINVWYIETSLSPTFKADNGDKVWIVYILIRHLYFLAHFNIVPPQQPLSPPFTHTQHSYTFTT